MKKKRRNPSKNNQQTTVHQHFSVIVMIKMKNTVYKKVHVRAVDLKALPWQWMDPSSVILGTEKKKRREKSWLVNVQKIHSLNQIPSPSSCQGDGSQSQPSLGVGGVLTICRSVIGPHVQSVNHSHSRSYLLTSS